MGSSLPKYLAKAEKAKLEPFEGDFSITIISITEPNNNEEEHQVYDVNVKLHKGILYINNPEISKELAIDKNIALVNKSNSNMTITLCISNEKMFWRFKAKRVLGC
jgi:hypothetical protein